tara:strand:+ start:401 stop:631 length:231 start_codon:yes stop_codon:yes gene_type:complete
MPVTFPLKINDLWQIKKDNVQWIMERRTNKKDGSGFSRWMANSFVHDKHIVERVLREEKITYPPDALDALPIKFIR